MKKLLPFLLMAMVLAGCAVADTPSDTEVQTRVASILTQGAPEATRPAPATPIPLPTLAVTLDETQAALATEAPTPEATELPTLTPQTIPTLDVTTVPTEQATPTATLEPTATYAPSDPRSYMGAPGFSDDMKNANNWDTSANDFSQIAFSNGAMILTGTSKQYGWRLSTAGVLSDFYLEMTGSFMQCTGDDAVGFYYRIPDGTLLDRGYLLGLTCSSKIWLKRWDATMNAPTGTMNILVSPRQGPVILTGQTFRLGVLVTGNNMKLFVNGIQVDEIADQKWPVGYYGIFVRPVDSGNMTVRITNISTWSLH